MRVAEICCHATRLAFTADLRALCTARKGSMVSLLAMVDASLESTARAAREASSRSDLPLRRRSAARVLFTSMTLAPASRRAVVTPSP